MSDWIYDDTFNPEEWAGFVYCITNTITGRKYIGRKYLEFRRRKQVKTKPGAQNKKKSVIVKTASDWLTYWGSSNILTADIAKYGSEHFTREIIHWCKTRSEANYLETKEMFLRDVLRARLPDGTRAYYNEHILMKFHAPKR